jgi:Protein of unknown function (DUF2911)
MNFKKPLFLLLAFALTSVANAQIKMPSPSPTYEFSGPVGLANVKVVYSRPSARERTIFGELVPFNKVWRTGANATTRISFSTDVDIEGNKVPAGDYALYTIPGEKESTIVISKNLGAWQPTGLDAKEDLVRFTVPTQNLGSMYETFTISLSDFTSDSAILNMKWEHTKMAFTISSDVEKYVMLDIKAKLIESKPSNRLYLQAANYYYDNDKDANLGLEWTNLAIEASGDEKKFWEYHLKAKLLVKLGQKKEAMSAAKESLDLAKTAENQNYVELNEKLIAGLK